METVLIDTFRVPHAAKEAFLARAHQAQEFVKTLPGFVEGFVYEQRASEAGAYQILTIAVWANEQAFEHAKQVVAANNQQQGINLQQVLAQLGIEFTRAVYDRAPY